MNDTAMHALGSYDDGKVLFLGLGTGLGSTTIANGPVGPMERATFVTGRGRSRITSCSGAGTPRSPLNSRRMLAPCLTRWRE